MKDNVKDHRPGGKSKPKINAKEAMEPEGPKGQGQMNEGGPAWSGAPRIGPGPTGKDAEKLQ